MNTSENKLDESLNPITPECGEVNDEVFFSAQRSMKPQPKLVSVAAATTAATSDRTPSCVWQKYRNRSLFFSAKVQSDSNELLDDNDIMNTTPTATDYDDISNDLCAAMNHLTFTQKKRIENSLKEHSMITRSDPRKSFLELRSRSIAKATLFDASVVDSAAKTHRKFRATPHVTKTRKMLFPQSTLDNSLTSSSVIMDQSENIGLCELKTDVKSEPIENVAAAAVEVAAEAETIAVAPETEVLPAITVVQAKETGEKSKLVRFDDEAFDSETKPERKTIGRKSIARSLSTSILKDITSSHGIPNIALTKSLTKCKPFSFESRDREYLKRKQERIKLGEELKANPFAARAPVAATAATGSGFHSKPVSTSKSVTTAPASATAAAAASSVYQQKFKPVPALVPPRLRTQPPPLNQLNSKRHFTFTKPVTSTSSSSTVNSTSTTTSSVFKSSIPKIAKTKLTVPIDFKFQSSLRAEQRAKNHQQPNAERPQTKTAVASVAKEMAGKSKDSGQFTFKARPASILHKKPFEIKKSLKPPTKPIDPMNKK